MSGEIINNGKKGKVIMWFFIVFILFITLVVWIYKYNGKFLPPQ